MIWFGQTLWSKKYFSLLNIRKRSRNPCNFNGSGLFTLGGDGPQAAVRSSVRGRLIILEQIPLFHIFVPSTVLVLFATHTTYDGAVYNVIILSFTIMNVVRRIVIARDCKHHPFYIPLHKRDSQFFLHLPDPLRQRRQPGTHASAPVSPREASPKLLPAHLTGKASISPWARKPCAGCAAKCASAPGWPSSL